MAKKIYTDIDLVGNKIENVSKINQKSIGDIDKFAVQLLSNAFDGPQFLSLSKNSTTTIYIRSNKLKSVRASLYNLLDTKLTSSVKVGTPISPTFLSDNNRLIPIDITTGDELDKVLYLNIEFYDLYVDLGLPSGTKWATMNVGASKPSDDGLYFQWGDTVGYTADQVGTGNGQKKFSWADYKWSIDGSSSNFSEYKTTGATLELEDDAAHVNMGGDWHIPTPTQIQELIDSTTTAWTTSDDGVNGITFSSKKDGSKSIFIPAAGCAWDGSVHDSRRNGFVWSSMLSAYDVNYGQGLNFGSSNVSLSNYRRYLGFSVRGVLG